MLMVLLTLIPTELSLWPMTAVPHVGQNFVALALEQ